MLHTLLHLIDDGSRMDGLTRTIDTPVGIDTGTRHLILPLIVAVLVAGVQFRTGLVVCRIGKHLTLTMRTVGFQEVFALGIRHHILHMIITVVSLLNTQMRSCDRLTRRGMHHDITQRLRLGLHDGIDIGDVIETAYRLHGRGGGKLHHIHTHRQGGECQRVFKELIGFLPRIGTGLLGSHTLDELLHLLIAGIIGRRGIKIAIGIQAIHLHRDGREVAQPFELNRLRLLGCHHLMIVRHTILRIGEFLFCIAQHAHPIPTAPLLKGFMDIGDTLCHRLSIHPVITVDREFAALLQITVFLDKGINLFNRRIAFQLSHHQTGGLTVASLGIIIVKRLQVIQLITDYTQQVVVEIMTVSTFLNKGLIDTLLHLS